MEATLDSVGRIVVPKPVRDALALRTGSRVDVSLYGVGIQIIPIGRTARLQEIDGQLVAMSETPVTDDDVLSLRDIGR